MRKSQAQETLTPASQGTASSLALILPGNQRGLACRCANETLSRTCQLRLMSVGGSRQVNVTL